MKSTVFLVPMMLACLATVGSHAQVVPVDPDVQAAQFQSVVVQAMDTAVVENGKLRSLKISLPGDRERSLTFEHSNDDRSFTMVDGSQRIHVVLDDLRRISEIIFPNGKRVEYDWAMTPTGYWVPSAMKVDGKDVRRSSILSEEGDCGAICERAAHAAVIALGVCAAAGPLTLPCWTATSAAAAAAYQCYRCSNPPAEEPPDCLFDPPQGGSYEPYKVFGKRHTQTSAGDHTDRRRFDLLLPREVQ